MTDVTGRTAFITGGANGIGLGIARSLARKGVKLALADVDAEALKRAQAELAPVTAVQTFVLDVRDRAAWRQAADAAEAQLGVVSLLFNNAGVAAGAPAHKLSFELWDWAMGINLNGVINGTEIFLPRMIGRGAGGHVVNTASGAGLAATAGSVYCAAKFGVVGMSEALSLELAPAGIGVSVLCPGPVATDVIARSAAASPDFAGLRTDEQKRKVADRAAMANAYLQSGASPDAVGEMVLAAIAANQLYIHTDRTMEDAIRARTESILKCLPTT